MSRRDLLRYAGVAALALTVGTETACSDLPKDPPELLDYENQAELTENPIFRASSIVIVSSSGLGHGGLFRLDGNLYIMTQQHVASDINDKPAFYIPGLGSNMFKVDNAWEPYYEIPDNDSNIRFLLSGDVAQKAEAAIKDGVLTPLSLFQGIVHVGDKFAMPMPNNGRVSIAAYSGFLPDKNLMYFNVENGYSCNGFSGTPILRVDENEDLTTQSIGLLTAATDDQKLFAGSACGNDYYFVKPHLKWENLK